jgi:hypothetical protein
MGQTIADRRIDRLCIIDDNKIYRNTLADIAAESEFEPMVQNDPVIDVDQFLIDKISEVDAVVSDHQLKIKNYFPENGAEIVSKCYARHIPSVLVTKYPADKDDIRRFRKNIPVILNPEDVEPDLLIHSFEICIEEFKGHRRSNRKEYRTLIRIDSVELNHIFVIIPAWDPNKTIALNFQFLPEWMRMEALPDKRFHATVNIDTELSDEIYFDNWEIK